MKKKSRKEKLYRNSYASVEKKRIILKSISKNFNLTRLTNWNASSSLTRKNLNYSTTKLTKRCVLTNRKNKSTNLLNISRLTFLHLARNGDIVGLKKAVW